jgi:hypothetical protein
MELGQAIEGNGNNQLALEAWKAPLISQAATAKRFR